MLSKYSAIVIAVFGFGIQNASAGNEQSECYHPLNGQSYADCNIPVAATSKTLQEAKYVPIQYYKIRYLGSDNTQPNDQFDPNKRN
jgi:hypothetical protein